LIYNVKSLTEKITYTLINKMPFKLIAK